VAVLDFDGTATPKYVIAVLRAVNNSGLLTEKGTARMKAVTDRFWPKYISDSLTDLDDRLWLESEAYVYASERLSVCGVHEALASVPLRPGFVEFLLWARDVGLPVAIISHGIEQFIESVLIHHRVEGLVQQIYAARMLVGRGGRSFVGLQRETVVTPASKGEMSRRFAALHGVAPDDILAVGDSLGDRFLGHRRENRLLLVADEAEAEKVRELGHVVVTDDFAPVQEWFRNKLGL
jgi:HAD superfamily phosphoserine phosphatase-like hydrolase